MHAYEARFQPYLNVCCPGCSVLLWCVQVMLRQAEAVRCQLVTVSQLIEQHAIM
jgi:hypothetical protein